MSSVTNCTSSSRPAGPNQGDLAFETDTKRLICYDGSAWSTYGSDYGPYVLDGSNTISVTPVCHFDAAKINGVDATGNPSDGDSLTSIWKSSYGTDYWTIAQSTASYQPTWNASGQNSKPYLHFDGTDILYLSKTISTGFSQPFSFWMVGDKTGNCWGPWQDAANNYIYFSHSNDDDYYYHSHAYGAEPTGYPKHPQIWNLHRDDSQETKMYHHGDNKGTAKGTKTNINCIRGFGRNLGASFGAIGRIYEMIFFIGSPSYASHGLLTDADLNKLNAYAHAKYNFSDTPTDY